jgi:hypothetical protein
MDFDAEMLEHQIEEFFHKYLGESGVDRLFADLEQELNHYNRQNAAAHQDEQESEKLQPIEQSSFRLVIKRCSIEPFPFRLVIKRCSIE